MTRPISATLLVVFALVVLVPPVRAAIARRRSPSADHRTKELV
jgi:putative tricarboxylic transport membrane protein